MRGFDEVFFPEIVLMVSIPIHVKAFLGLVNKISILRDPHYSPHFGIQTERVRICLWCCHLRPSQRLNTTDMSN